MSLNLAKLEAVTSCGGRTTARCPACAEAGSDKSGNHLIIFPDGRFACVMHEGPEGHNHRRRIAQLAGRDDVRPQPQCGGRSRPPQRGYPTAEEAAGVIARHIGGTVTRLDRYHNTHGQDVMAIARIDGSPRGKTYRPIHVTGLGWVAGDPPGRLPLLDLTGLKKRADSPVLVPEGEKCKEALGSLGFLATTSAHGAKSARKSDWTPLAGRDVVILPDHDAPGEQYARDVADILSRLDPPARVRIGRLPGLEAMGEGADIVDWLDARDAQEPEAIRAELDTVITSATACTSAGQQGVTPPVDASPNGGALTEQDDGPLFMIDGAGKPVAINQLSIAAKFAQDHLILFEPTEEQFYVYRPATGLWEPTTDAVVAVMVARDLQRNLDANGGLVLLKKRTQNLVFQILGFMKGIAQKRDVFCGERRHLHVRNGVLNLDGQIKLQPFNPELYDRNGSDVAYCATASCPRFLSELLEPALDADDIALLQRYAGQCLLGHTNRLIIG